MANKERVARLSSYLWWVCAVLIYALPVAYLVLLGLAVQAPGWPQAQFPGLVIATQPGWPSTALVLALAVIVALPVLYMLVEMRSLFGNYRRGQILTEGSARNILGIGRAMVSLAVLKVVVPTMQMALLSSGRTLSLNLNDNFAIFLLAGGFLITIGWAMREAADVAEENRGFV